jgi:hypothetical protein
MRDQHRVDLIGVVAGGEKIGRKLAADIMAGQLANSRIHQNQLLAGIDQECIDRQVRIL